MALSGIRPVRTGILKKLADVLPPPSQKASFNPISIAINLTNRCNAACEICLEDANQKQYPPFTLEETIGLLKQAREIFPTVNQLHLWGGEPFLDLDLLYAITGAAKELGFSLIGIATNGFWGAKIEHAREIIKNLYHKVNCLELSCDNFHNFQPILDVNNLANIIYLVKTEFPAIEILINCIGLKDFKAQHALAEALTKKFSPVLSVIFDDKETGAFSSISEEGRGKKIIHRFIRTSFFQPSLSGRSTDRFGNIFWADKANSEYLSEYDKPIDQSLSIGIDRQLYINLLFTSNGVLPMGSTRDFSLKELVSNINADPIAVSLINHCYAEMYPYLKKVFPEFDNWIKQFYTYYDALQGLEKDPPTLIKT